MRNKDCRTPVRYVAWAMIALIASLQADVGQAQETQVLDLAIEQGRFTNAADTVRVTEGDKVTLRIASDQSGELHLHGYNVAIKLVAGKTVVVDLDARVSGRFPITSHGFAHEKKGAHRHMTLLYLEVYPR